MNLIPNKKVIIDCDPGIDDALALMLALASKEIEPDGPRQGQQQKPHPLYHPSSGSLCHPGSFQAVQDLSLIHI